MFLLLHTRVPPAYDASTAVVSEKHRHLGDASIWQIHALPSSTWVRMSLPHENTLVQDLAAPGGALNTTPTVRKCLEKPPKPM